MTIFWAVLLGLLIIAVLVLLVAVALYAINRVFGELMKHRIMDEEYKNICRLLSVAFMQHLDENRKPGKMCLSNGECADIDKAFAAQDWAKLNRYAEKYLG